MALHQRSPGTRSATAVALVLALVLTACGGRSTGPTFERAITPPGLAVPADFPSGFVVPDDWVLVGADEARVEADYGATASWQAGGDYDEAIKTVETILTSLGWEITRRIDDSIDGTDEKSLVLYTDGSPLLRVRFNDNSALDGVLVTAEAPV